MQNDNLTFNPIPVYFLSEHGYAPTQAGIEACQDAADQGITTERWQENCYDGIVIHSGKDLLDPAHLLDLLKSHPDAFLAVSIDGCIDFGSMDENTKIVAYYWLEKAIKEKKNSWDMLAIKIRRDKASGQEIPTITPRTEEK